VYELTSRVTVSLEKILRATQLHHDRCPAKV